MDKKNWKHPVYFQKRLSNNKFYRTGDLLYLPIAYVPDQIEYGHGEKVIIIASLCMLPYAFLVYLTSLMKIKYSFYYILPFLSIYLSCLIIGLLDPKFYGGIDFSDVLSIMIYAPIVSGFFLIPLILLCVHSLRRKKIIISRKIILVLNLKKIQNQRILIEEEENNL